MINSLMRTLVPAIYLGLIHLGLSKDIPQDWVLNLISLVVLAGVYLALRVLEQRWRWVGLLLGWIGAPSYDQPAHDAVDQAQAATLDDIHGALANIEAAIVGRVSAEVHAIVTSVSDRQTAEIAAAVKPTPVTVTVDAPTAKTPAKKAAAKRPARKAPAKKAAPPKE